MERPNALIVREREQSPDVENVDILEKGRAATGETIAVDRRRAIRRIIVAKRPGLREGESELQVLAVPEKAKGGP